MKRALFVPVAVLLAACGQVEEVAPPELTRAQKNYYAISCANCHDTEAIGVPQRKDRDAWQARLAQRGLAGLTANTKRGFGGMPPFGSCPGCSDEDLEALTRYLITGTEASP